MDNNIPNSPDFSDVPALGDVQGLEAFLNNEALAAQGLPTQPAQEQPAQSAEQNQPAAQQPAENGQQAATTTTPNASGDTITLTREQLNAILAGRGQAAQVERPAQPKTPTYSAQEQVFISRALAQGYSLDQINTFLARQKANPANNPVLEQRLNQVEQYLRTQEYQAAQNAFIDKLSNFGSKWGLSEQDLVMFGNEALKHGINISSKDIDLEMVFRAVYPEQYSIRSRRMTPTTSSQIYGGTSIPEGSRAQTSKLEDAYVEAFLKGAMPNQYAASIKK